MKIKSAILSIIVLLVVLAKSVTATDLECSHCSRGLRGVNETDLYEQQPHTMDISDSDEELDIDDSDAEEEDPDPIVEDVARAKVKGPDNIFYGTVWEDQNENSMIDPREAGVEGATVWLYRYRKTSNGDKPVVRVKSRITDAGGFFELPLNKMVRNSAYYLKVVPNFDPDLFQFGPIIEGADNHVTGKRGNSKRQVVQIGTNYEVNAAVIRNKIFFYGKVWYDDNENSMIDIGEKGVQGAKVWLYRYRKTSDGITNFIKVKLRNAESDGSFELPLNKIADDGEYYLKFVHDKMADYEFGPIVPGGDNAVTGKRGNSKRHVVEYGMRYLVNAALVRKKAHAPVTGAVTWKGGLPVNGARVWTNNDPIIETNTGPDGQFTLPAVPEGRIRVSASATIDGRFALEREEVLVISAGVSGVSFILDPSKHERVVTVFGRTGAFEHGNVIRYFVRVTLPLDPWTTSTSKNITHCARGDVRVEQTFSAYLSPEDLTTVDVEGKQQVFRGTSCETGDLVTEADDDFSITILADDSRSKALSSPDFARTDLVIVNGNQQPGSQLVSVTGALKVRTRCGASRPANKKTISINHEFRLTTLQPYAEKSWSVCADDKARIELDVYVMRDPGGYVNAETYYRFYIGACSEDYLFGRRSQSLSLDPDTEEYVEVKILNQDPYDPLPYRYDYGLAKFTIINTHFDPL